MPKINFFSKKLNIVNKTIIIRTDFNVPLNKNRISDSTRIDLVIPLLKNLSSKKAKIILISHLGRPKGKFDKKYSLKPVFKYLKKRFKNKVHFYSGLINSRLNDNKTLLKNGEILFLENIRFFKEETDNDLKFSKKLAKLGDIYINEAFSCSHRKQASIYNLAKLSKKSYAGPLMQKEIISLEKIIKNKKTPLTCIIGGSKVSTKIGVLKNLIKHSNNLIIVGAMANNFINYQYQCEMGNSLIEKNVSKTIKSLYSQAKKQKCNVIIPSYVAVSSTMNGKREEKFIHDIKKGEIILDIGSRSLGLIKHIILNSKTTLWNGPAGYFENKYFSFCTQQIAITISNLTKKNKLISILGGGDTVAAINNIKKKLHFTHLSTAGGAFLEFIEGKSLPGIDVLK